MLLLKNATVYPQTEKAPFVGDVLCENGRIKEIGKDLFADEIERGELQEISVEAPQTIVNYQLAFLKHGQNVLTESLAALASQCVISH